MDRIHAHALRLSDLGHLEDARRLWSEALPLARTLERRGVPERSGNVAVALGSLALVLSDLGQYDDAVSHGRQAVDINRRLVQQRPGGTQALGNLGASLSNLAKFFSEQGRHEAALAPSREALAICRRLAATQSDVFEGDLARYHGNLASHLRNLGRFVEALPHTEAAVEIFRRLAAARNDAFEGDLATSLGNLAGDLNEQGRFAEALPHAEAALKIYCRLAGTRPDAFGGILANFLGIRSLLATQLGYPAGAREFAAEAVRLLEAQPGARSAGLQAELMWTLAMHGWSLLELADLDAALGPVGRACALADSIRATRPAAAPMQTALAYWLGWRCAVALGDREQAQCRADQALRVLNHWVEQGAAALPAHLLAPAAELLRAVADQPGDTSRFAALGRLLADI